MNAVEVKRGSGPIVLAMPHTGTYVPGEIFDNLTDLGKGLCDTDWHIDRLYENLLPDVTCVRALFHRYVVDANRDPKGASLYPGQNTTGLVPLTDFDGEPLWSDEPDHGEIEERRLTWHTPYHGALLNELERVKALHGHAVLYDCHSIRSRIPFLFEGILPDFSIGTNDGKSCHPMIETAAVAVCEQAAGYTSVLNGRFKGGWTTRHYGQPDTRIHAIQMELAQSTYMVEAAPWTWLPKKAEKLRKELGRVLHAMDELSRRGALR